jgi:hypothetical protein
MRNYEDRYDCQGEVITNAPEQFWKPAHGEAIDHRAADIAERARMWNEIDNRDMAVAARESTAERSAWLDWQLCTRALERMHIDVGIDLETLGALRQRIDTHYRGRVVHA